MLFLLLSWALYSLFHCIPILTLCKCPFTAQSYSIPVHRFIVYGSPCYKRREILFVCGGFLNSFLFLFDSYQYKLQDIYICLKLLALFFLPIMEGGLRQAAVIQHLHTACSVSSRWESSVSVYKMFLWSEIQLLVGLLPQWDLALCYQFWKHWISKAAFTVQLCPSWNGYLTMKSVKDTLLVFLGSQLGFFSILCEKHWFVHTFVSL